MQVQWGAVLTCVDMIGHDGRERGSLSTSLTCAKIPLCGDTSADTQRGRTAPPALRVRQSLNRGPVHGLTSLSRAGTAFGGPTAQQVPVCGRERTCSASLFDDVSPEGNCPNAHVR